MEMPEKMKIAAVICELDPLHFGHRYLLERAREGHDGVVCVLSGSFVQRGEPAFLDKWARTRLALSAGADLVMELPLPWSCAGAERFAAGGVALAEALGCVESLVFGSETGEIGPLREAADALLSPDFSRTLAALPDTGEPFARRRERVIARLLGEDRAALLRRPNDILGVEYCKALAARGSAIRPVAVKRRGAAHGGAAEPGTLPSAGELRERFRAGEDLTGLAPAETAALLSKLRARGKVPAELSRLETAILCKLRMMTAEDFATLPDLSEGLEHRLYAASREARTLHEFYERVKTKRYAHARLRRLTLYAFLGVTADLPARPPSLRLLGMTGRGEAILHQAAPALPLIARPADLEKAGEEARRVFALEARAGDLRALALPVPDPCGRDYTEKLIKAP